MARRYRDSLWRLACVVTGRAGRPGGSRHAHEARGQDKMIKALQGMVEDLEIKLAAVPKASSTCSGIDDGKKDRMIKVLQGMIDDLEAKLLVKV